MISTSASVSRITNFEACGLRASLASTDDTPPRYKILGSGCHDRFCVPCARDRSHVVGQAIVDYLGARPVRFVTLTLKSSTASLTDQLNRLYDSFATLRRRAFWTRHVVGGLAVLEVTLGRDDRWHPHFHVLVQGTYLAHRELKRLWYEITGDSFIVDVRMARSNEEVVQYVAKYITKSCHADVTRNDAMLQEAITALHGRKMIVPFGTWRDIQTTCKPAENNWQYVCTLHELVERAQRQRGDWLAILLKVAPHCADALLAMVPTDGMQGRPPPVAPAQIPDYQPPLIGDVFSTHGF